MQLEPLWRGLFLTCLLLSLLLPGRGHADEVSGDWSGEVSGRVHYFWERSTRVVLPEGTVKVESPDGLRLGAGVLVDVITSASIAFAGTGEDALFTEYRYQPELRIGKEFRLSNSKLDLEGFARFSTETDYESYVGGANTRLSVNQDNTVIGLSIVGLHDDIRANNDAGFRETLDNWTLSGDLEQVVNPTTYITLGYQVGVLNGFMGNAYRRVLRDGAPLGESPPRTRIRHTLHGKVATYIPPLAGAVHLMLKGYTDTWNLQAISPELRLYKEIGDAFMVRLRYRFYAQTEADFFRPVYPADWPGSMTADPKLNALQSHTIGARVDLDTLFLLGSALDFAGDSSLYLSVDRMFTEISFGNALIGTAGGTLRF